MIGERITEENQTADEDLAAGGKRMRLKRLGRRVHARRQKLVSTAALPVLFTVLNGLSGFASIHFATKDALGEAALLNLAMAGWLIFAAMVLDMLDGRVARITRRTSDFGGQLDSLCDMISFGVAPAMLMLRAVVMVLRGQVERVDILPGGLAIERVIWCVAGAYVACAALRLARFNVENDPDESSHMEFRGLPSPGAAAAIAAMVLLFASLAPLEKGWRSSTWILATVSITLPVITLIFALLMVSRFKYPHIVNYYIRNRKPFGFLVKLVLLLLAAMLWLFVTGVLLTLGYALSGPARAIWSRIRNRRRPRAQDVQVSP